MAAHAPPPETPAYVAALRSADVLRQNEGVSAAIALGASAVPVLLGVLAEPGIARSQVVYALAEIADARARQAFAAGLGDADEKVRAQSARGLARLGDPSAVDACLRVLNDDPDPLHLDQTPAVQALGALGLAAVPALLDRMAASDRTTRLHAQRALELVLARRHGFRPGQGFADPQAETAMRAEWTALGNYAHDAPAKRRAQAIQQWRQWLQGTGGTP